MKLSNALGFAVGIHANSDDSNIEKKSCVYDESEVIMALYQVGGVNANIIRSQNKDVIFSFLRVSIHYI